MRPGFGSVNLTETETGEKVGEEERLVFLSARVCIPVVFVSEVVDDSGADAGHSPLAVVPSSCDDRELRLTQTLCTLYTKTHKNKNKNTKNVFNSNKITRGCEIRHLWQ